MAEEPTASGWLPPHAPGAKPPPRFEPAPEPTEPTEPDEAPAAPATPAGEDPAPGGWAPPAATPPAGPSPPTAAPASAPDGGTPPSFVASPSRSPANSLAVVSLVLSSCGLALLLLSLGLSFIFSIPLAGGGWVAAQRARNRMARGEPGGGQVKAAFWLALATTVLAVGAAVAWIVLITVFDFSLEDFRRDLERELERQREQQGSDDPRALLEGMRLAAHALLRPF